MVKKRSLGEQFYDAFKRKDLVKIDSLYHDELEFQDEAFGPLDKRETMAMWEMLFSRNSKMKVDFKVLHQTKEQITVVWEAKYTYEQTNRFVHNVIEATFDIKDGKIYRHRDRFSLYKWSKMAFGWKGYVLGFTPFFRKFMQRKVDDQLFEFMLHR